MPNRFKIILIFISCLILFGYVLTFIVSPDSFIELGFNIIAAILCVISLSYLIYSFFNWVYPRYNAYCKKSYELLNEQEQIRNEPQGLIVTKANEQVSVSSLYEQGYQLWMQAKYREALGYFDKALAIDSSHLLAWCYKGTVFGNLGHWSEAISAYDVALKLDKDYIFAMAGKAYALFSGGRITDPDLNTFSWMSESLNITDSQKLFKKIVSLKPKENVAFDYLGRGMTYILQGEHDLAIADFSEAIRINPQYAETYLYRGTANQVLKKYDLAIVDFTKAIMINTQFVLAYYNRGLTYYAQGEYDLAIRDYTQAIIINPLYVEAYYNRGITHYNKRDYKSTRLDLEKVVELDPTGPMGQMARNSLQILNNRSS